MLLVAQCNDNGFLVCMYLFLGIDKSLRYTFDKKIINKKDFSIPMTVRPAPSPRQAQVTSPTSTHVEAPPRSARPFATVPLWVMFALQVLLLAAGYGGITVLFQKTQNH